MATSPLPPSGFYRWPLANSSRGSFVLAGGFIGTTTVSPADLNPFPLSEAESLKLCFGGVGANGNQYNYRLWVCIPTYGIQTSPGAGGAMTTDPVITGYYIEVYGYGTVTLGTATVMGGAAGSNALRIATTVTFTLATSATTPVGVGGIIEAGYASAGTQTLSGVSPEPAVVLIPRSGWFNSIITEFAMTTATSAFAMIARA